MHLQQDISMSLQLKYVIFVLNVESEALTMGITVIGNASIIVYPQAQTYLQVDIDVISDNFFPSVYTSLTPVGDRCTLQSLEPQQRSFPLC